ncbi:PH domain-containing protein [Patescibacteria group bacterium]|nr:PH domain-containing protein [Patescibacteria group bacterium]
MKFTKILKENEELARLVRRHPLVYFKTGLIALVIFLLPFFFMFLLFKWGRVGLILFAVLIISGVYAMIRLAVVYSFNVFLITNQRIILYEQNGLFDRNVSEVEYDKIQDISHRFKGLGQTMFKYGSLKIQIKNSESILYVKKIFQPDKIQQLLLKIQKNTQA